MRSSFSPRISICASAQEQLLPEKHQHPTLRIPNTRPPELVTTTQFSMQGMYYRQHLNDCHIYLQFLVATATSCPNNLSLASNGRLQTQKARDMQSEVSLMYPFLLATLKFGSASEIAYSLAASQKQQKILSRQSCSWSIKQYLPQSLPEPVLDSLSSLRLFCSAMTLLKIKLKLIQKPERWKQAEKSGVRSLGKNGLGKVMNKRKQSRLFLIFV